MHGFKSIFHHLKNSVGIFFGAGFIVILCSLDLYSQSVSDSLHLQQSLNRYNTFVLHMAHDSLAHLFAENGELVRKGSTSIIGPAAIYTYLASFNGFTVLENSMHADQVHINNLSAVQSGTYSQKVRIPSGDTVAVHGRFHIEWQKNSLGVWHIQKMSTEQ